MAYISYFLWELFIGITYLVSVASSLVSLPCEQLVSPTPNALVWHRRNQLLARYGAAVSIA